MVVLIVIALGVIPAGVLGPELVTPLMSAVAGSFVWYNPLINVETRRMELRGSSNSQEKSSPSIGRCEGSCTTIRSIASSTFRSKRPSAAANSSWEAMGISPAISIGASQVRAVISVEDLDAALKPLARDPQVLNSAQRLHPRRGLAGLSDRRSLRPGRGTPRCPLFDPYRRAIDRVAAKQASASSTSRPARADRTSWRGIRRHLGRWLTLSHWCDDTLGRRLSGRSTNK